MSELREKYRLEWENIVISLINSGWSKGEAQHEADDRLNDKYVEGETLNKIFINATKLCQINK